jgi:hypothetical protein
MRMLSPEMEVANLRRVYVGCQCGKHDAGRGDAQPKKARTGRAESIFLEEDRGDDSDYPDPAAVNPIAISDIDHTNPE